MVRYIHVIYGSWCTARSDLSRWTTCIWTVSASLCRLHTVPHHTGVAASAEALAARFHAAFRVIRDVTMVVHLFLDGCGVRRLSPRL